MENDKWRVGAEYCIVMRHKVLKIGKVVGENKLYWVLDDGMRLSKKTLIGRGGIDFINYMLTSDPYAQKCINNKQQK